MPFCTSVKVNAAQPAVASHAAAAWRGLRREGAGPVMLPLIVLLG